MERVETIREVTTKELPPKDGKPAATLYLIFDSTGTEFTTMKRELAKVAYEAVASGAYVHLGYDEKSGGQYGQFTNRYLNSISLIDGGSEHQTSVSQAMKAAQEAAAQRSAERPPGLFDDAAPEQPQSERRIDREDQKRIDIARAVALKEAVNLLPYLPVDERTLQNVKLAALNLTQFLLTGEE